MRGEGWTLGGGRRAGGGGGGKQEEKACVPTLSHTTEFGWLLPTSEARRQDLINTTWLRDFSRDIEVLQEEVKRQTVCVFSQETSYQDVTGRDSNSEVKQACVHEERNYKNVGESHTEIERLQCKLRRHPFMRRGERTRHNGDSLRTEYHSAECCVAMKGLEGENCSVDVKCKRLSSAVVTSSREAAVSSSLRQTHVANSSKEATDDEMASTEKGNRVDSDCGRKMREEGESHPHKISESTGSEVMCDLHPGLGTFSDDAAECDVYKMQHKEKTSESASDEESGVGEESFLLGYSLSTFGSGTAKCDAYSSMHSDVSRDSGIFTADDTSFLSEAPGDMSLLQELGDVLSDQDVSLESCIHCGSLPLEDIEPGIKGHAGYTVLRFSSNSDLSSICGSHEWEVRHDELTPNSLFGSVSPVVVRRGKCTSKESDSNVTGKEEQEEEVKGKQCSGCEKINGVKVKQCRTCEILNDVNGKKCFMCKNLDEAETELRRSRENHNDGADVREQCEAYKMIQESPKSQKPTRELSVMEKFTQSFQNINKRMEDLRSGLHSLVGEVRESKNDFMSLEKQTSQLLASTVSSRLSLTRVRALQLLEDRLQEEWWAAYDPGSVPFHENYIV